MAAIEFQPDRPKDYQPSISEWLKIIDATNNEADLTDEELQKRLDALVSVRYVNKSTDKDAVYKRTLDLLREKVPEIVSRFGEDKLQEDAMKITNLVINGDDASGLPQYLRQSAKIIKDELPNFTTPERDFSKDIDRVKDLIKQRKNKAESEKQVTDYLTSLPGELSKTREDVLSNEQERALGRYSESVVPATLQNLNARGVLFSGDTEDLLTAEALNLDNELNAFRNELEQQDSDFYFNAAYQNKIRQLLESNVNLQSQINFERNNVLTEQARRFQVSQSDLNRKLDERLYESDAQRRLRLNEAQLRLQKDTNDKAKKNAVYGQIGSVGGAIIGTYVSGGNPAGTAIGSQIGGSVAGNAAAPSAPSRIGG